MVMAEDLEAMGVQIILSNTYHLHLRPGEDIVKKSGGLHGFMQWDRPITTDSGGYQVFSLGDHVKIDDDGVSFRAPLDGSLQRFTPESVIQIQADLGADIIMPLDVCTPFKAGEGEVAAAVDKTSKWARRCYEAWQGRSDSRQALYGIVQGGVFPELRRKSAHELTKINFSGFSIGGELREGGEKQLAQIVPLTAKLLPSDKPRYLMGYGLPEDILVAVRGGVDQFDCVLPVRNARHGQLFYDLDTDELAKTLTDPERPVSPENLYRVVDITKAAFARDFAPFSPGHPVIRKNYTRSYVHHLMRAEVPSGMRLTVLHNIFFYENLMREIRRIIDQNGR